MKDKIIHCRVNSNTHEKIKEAANKAGVSITEYVIYKVLESSESNDPRAVKGAIQNLCDVYTEVNKLQALFVNTNTLESYFESIWERMDQLQCTLNSSMTTI